MVFTTASKVVRLGYFGYEICYQVIPQIAQSVPTGCSFWDICQSQTVLIMIGYDFMLPKIGFLVILANQIWQMDIGNKQSVKKVKYNLKNKPAWSEG